MALPPSNNISPYMVYRTVTLERKKKKRKEIRIASVDFYHNVWVGRPTCGRGAGMAKGERKI
jgi:hypothetical protein